VLHYQLCVGKDAEMLLALAMRLQRSRQMIVVSQRNMKGLHLPLYCASIPEIYGDAAHQRDNEPCFVRKSEKRHERRGGKK
jgi:hypothetical protein